MIHSTLFFLLLLGVSSCYQMRPDDDLRTVPTTNNRNIIQDTSQTGGFQPSMSY
jgi:hypothetical protein